MVCPLTGEFVPSAEWTFVPLEWRSLASVAWVRNVLCVPMEHIELIVGMTGHSVPGSTR